MNNSDINVIIVNCDEDFETDLENQKYVINTVVNKINLIKKNILNDTVSFCSIKNKIYIEEESDNEHIIEEE